MLSRACVRVSGGRSVCACALGGRRHVSTKGSEAAPSAVPKVTALTSEQVMAREDKFGAHNYKPLPVVIARGEGEFYLCMCVF